MLVFRNAINRVTCRRRILSSNFSLLKPVFAAHTVDSFDGQTRQVFDNDRVDRKAVEAYLDKELENMNISDISYLLYTAGIKRVDLNEKYITTISATIAQSRIDFTKVEIARLMYGLKMFKPTKATLAYVNAMAVVMRHHAPNRLDARSLGMCLYGLQNMSSDVSSVNDILHVLNSELANCDQEFDAHTLSNSLRVLTRKKSKNQAVRELLSILFTKIMNSKDLMTAQQFARSIQCLANMNSEDDEVRGILTALLSKGRTCSGRFTANEVGDMLYGLQNMDCSHDEVQQMLQLVSISIRDKPVKFTPSSLSRSLFSLRNFNPKIPAVAELFSELSTSLATSKMHNISNHEFGHAMLGLQNCSINQSGIPAILNTLASAISVGTEPMNLADIKLSLRGLRNVVAGHSSRAILTRLNSEFKNNDEKLSTQVISFILSAVGTMNSDYHDVREVMATLADKIETADSKFVIGNSKYFFLYNLHGMDSRHKEVLKLLRALTPALSAPVNSFTSKDVGTALYGLSGMNSTFPEVRAVLRILLNDWKNQGVRLDSQAVGNAVYGLQNMSPEYPEVREMFSIVAEMIQRSSGTAKLSAHAASMAIYGLKGVEAHHQEVRKLLGSITPLVKQCDGDFSTVCAGNVLYGLRRMNSDFEEVRTLLEVLAVKITDCSHMRFMDVSIALYGMRNMSSVHGAVRDMISAIKVQLDNTIRRSQRSEGMSNSFISKAIYGMNKMADDNDIVLELIGSLSDAYANCTDLKLRPQELSMLMFGLRYMSSNKPPVASILNRVVVPHLPDESVCLNPVQMGQVLEGMRNFSGDHKAVMAIISFIIQKLEKDGGVALRSQQVVSCVEGLRTICQSDSAEAKALIIGLTAYFKSCEFVLTSSDVRHCRFLLAPISTHQEEIQLLFEEVESHHKF